MNGKLAGLAVLGLLGLVGYVSNENKNVDTPAAEEAARQEVRKIFEESDREFVQREIAEQVKAQTQEKAAREWKEPQFETESKGDVRHEETQAPKEDEKSISVIDMAQKLCNEADKLLAERAEKMLDRAIPVAMTMLPQGGTCNCGPRLDSIEKKLAAIEARFNAPLKGAAAPVAAEAPKAEPSKAPAAPAQPHLYFNPATGTYSDQPVTSIVAPVGVVCDANGVCQVPQYVTPGAVTAAPTAPVTSYVYNPATGTYDTQVFSSLPRVIAVETMGAACDECTGPLRRLGAFCFPRIANRIRARRSG